MRYRSPWLRCAAFVLCITACWSPASAHAADGNAQSDTTAELLDVDGNGRVDALTDGLLMMRYIFGLRGQPLIQNAIGPGATRSTAAQIESYMATLYTTPQPGGGTVTAPSNCSVTQFPNTTAASVAAGTSVSLNVNCAGGSAPTSCSWNNGLSSTSCSVNIIAPATTTTYSIIASNSAGAAAPVSTILNVSAPVGGSQDFCTGNDEIIQISWPATGQFKWNTAAFKNQRVAFKLLVPDSFSPPLDIAHSGYMRVLEVPGSTVATRDVTVSKNSCDFQSGNYLFNGIGTGDTAPYISFATNNPNGYKTIGAQMNINSGDTIYVNVRNQYNGGSTCPYPSCDVSLDLATPNRY